MTATVPTTNRTRVRTSIEELTIIAVTMGTSPMSRTRRSPDLCCAWKRGERKARCEKIRKRSWRVNWCETPAIQTSRMYWAPARERTNTTEARTPARITLRGSMPRVLSVSPVAGVSASSTMNFRGHGRSSSKLTVRMEKTRMAAIRGRWGFRSATK